MQQFRTLLRQNKTADALERFKELVAQNEERRPELLEAVTKVLKAEFDAFSVYPVITFCKLLKGAVPEDVSAPVLDHVRPHVKRALFYKNELEAVTRERLAREAQAMVTLNRLDEAADRLEALVKRGSKPSEMKTLARYGIEALGVLSRDEDRTRKVVAEVFGERLKGKLNFEWREAYHNAVKAGASRLQASNREWTQAMVSAATALREFLPPRGQTDKPSDEELERFLEEFKNLIRGGLADGGLDLFIDAINVAKEYSPADPPVIESVAGVEPRLFISLGNKGKLISARAVRQLGEYDVLRARIALAAKKTLEEDRIQMWSGIMGGMRHPDFMPWLNEALKESESRKDRRDREAVLDAMSRIGTPEVIKLLLNELEDAASDIKDGRQARVVEMMLKALGRVNRTADLTPEQRNAMIKRAIKAVGDDDTHLAYTTAAMLFNSRLNEIEPTLRIWAMKQVVRAMFRPDSGNNLKDSNQSQLGFRAPMVPLLAKLGKIHPKEMFAAAKAESTRFSGGFSAFSEVLQEIGDPSGVEVLEQMSMTAFMHDDEAEKGSFMRERVRDSATGEMKDLEKGEVLHSILFAIEKIGGDRAKEVLLDFADRVQTGQLKNPGEGPASVLFRAKKAWGEVGKLQKRASTGPAVEESEYKSALKEAKGGLFSSAPKQIAALNVLGRAKNPESLGVILSCMGSKETLVRTAAETAMAEFVIPPPPPKRYTEILDALFDNEKLLKQEGIRNLFLEVFGRSFPKKPPYDEIYKKQLAVEISDGELQHRLRGALVAATMNSGAAAEEDDAAPSELDMLEQKRIYYQKRQEWIAAGKHGPPPEPPQ